MPFRRIARSLLLVVLVALLPVAARAQVADSSDVPSVSSNYWQVLTLGAVTSILAHESGHILTAVAMGKHPTFGFDKLRPTIYSGIDSHTDPHAQFLFSAAGLTVQSVIDEAILDIPHVRGSAFERGVLGGGIGTTIFYLTIGRRGSVSDIDFISRVHGMTVTQSTLLFGGIAAMHIYRMSRDSHYANFFARPRGDGGVDVGLNMGPF